MIRLPDIPGQPRTNIGAPGVSARAIGAGAVALGDVATAIAGVSDQFHATAVRIQRVENARKLSEKRNELSQAYAQHQIDLQTDPDPVSRMQKTRAFLSNAKGGIESDELPPELRQNLAVYYDDFASKALINQGADSANLSMQRAKLAFQNEITNANQTLDRTKLETALATAQDAGVILPEETDPFIRDFERSVASTELDLAIQEEPGLVLEDMQREDFFTRFPGLNPTDMPRIQSAARSSIQRKRSEEMDLIEAALIEGKLTPEDLEGASFLTPKDIAQVKSAMADARPPDTSKHSAAWDHLFKLREDFKNPAVSDEQYAERWNETRSSIFGLLPPAFQGDLKQELSYRSPANRRIGEVEERPDAQARDFGTLMTARIKKAFDDGLLGDVTDPASATAKKAYTRMEDARAEVIRYIRQNPQATFPEIREFTTRALGGTLDDGDTDAPLIPSAPPAVSFDTRLNSVLGLPGGTAESSDALLPPKP